MEDNEPELKYISNALKNGIKKESEGDLEGARDEYNAASRALFRLASRYSGNTKYDFVTRAEVALKKADELGKRAVSGKRVSEPEQKSRDLKDDLQIDISEPAALQDVKFSDIAGLEDVKKIIQVRIIDAARNPELASKFQVNGGNFLLYGPPGTGKTLIVHAIAHEIGYPVIVIDPAMLLNPKFGQFEKNINDLFKKVQEMEKCILFFDEFDSLAPSRSRTNSSYMKRAVPELLMDLDRLNTRREGKIIVIAATNEPWSIDPAIMRAERFDDVIFVPLPDKEARKQMLQKYLSEMLVSPDIDYEGLAAISDGLTGAEIRNVCRKSGEKVFGDVMSDSQVRSINDSDVRDIITNYRRSVTDKMLEKYTNFTDSSKVHKQ